jgi:hypothetical protein
MSINTNPRALAALFLSDVESDNGSSRSFADLSVPPTYWYMVSFKSPTVVTDSIEIETVISFIDAAVVSGVANAGTYLGGWVNGDDGKLHLDVSIAIPDRRSAEILGRAMGQIAIYQVGVGEIRL